MFPLCLKLKVIVSAKSLLGNFIPRDHELESNAKLALICLRSSQNIEQLYPVTRFQQQNVASSFLFLVSFCCEYIRTWEVPKRIPASWSILIPLWTGEPEPKTENPDNHENPSDEMEGGSSPCTYGAWRGTDLHCPWSPHLHWLSYFKKQNPTMYSVVPKFSTLFQVCC